jgi:hypothetical protein
MSSGPTLSPQPAAAPPKKSNKVLLWVLGGIAAFIFLCIVAFAGLTFFVFHKVKQAGFDTELMKKNPGLAAAKMMAAANPDAEVLSTNDSSGTIVIRDKKTGKVMTMKFDPDKKSLVVIDDKGEQAKFTADTDKGTVEIQGKDGTVKFGNTDKAPSWVPVYPGSSPQGTFSASGKDGQTGSFTFTTNDAVDKIVSYYADNLSSAGFKASRTTSSADGKNSGVVTGEGKASGRTVVVSAGSGDQGTQVNVTFEEKKTPQ